MEEDRRSRDSSRIASNCEKHGDRTRFTVELRPGETTIVSWKKLVKDVAKANGSAPSSSFSHAVAAPEPPSTGVHHPGLESRLAPGQPASNELKDPAAAPNRFNSVIEKIERLYMGKDSSDDEELGDVPDDDQYDTEDSFIDDAELDEYFEVDKAKTKHDGFFVNRGKLENIIEPSLSPTQQPRKRRRKEMVKSIGDNDHGHATNNHMKISRKGAGKITPALESNSFPTPGSSSGTNLQKTESGHLKNQEKCDSGQLKLQTVKTNNAEQSFQHREKNGIRRELIDLNVAASKHPMKTSSVHKREGSSFKSKGTMLDKAIRELEKMVAESRPPAMDLQEPDATSQAVKRRLSQEIKQKLAKVARVAQVSNGKVSNELLSRLMSIVGHLVNVRTLKRNLNMMITSSLSLNKEKDEKFQQIKKDVVELIKIHPPPLISKVSEQQNGSADDFQESRPGDKGVTKVKYTMHPEIEDKICVLYDIFIDGLDDDVAPQVRKLYAELAALWPGGVMDNHGIKRAICRSKERSKALEDKNKEQELIKKKRVESIPVESTSTLQPQHPLFTPSGSSATTSTTPLTMTIALPAPTNAQHYDRPKPEKIKGPSSSGSYVEIRAADGTMVKKKVKRKPEKDPREVRPQAEKLSLNNESRLKTHKQQQSAGALVVGGGAAPDPSFPSTLLPSFQQQT